MPKPAATPADKAFAASMQTMMKNMSVKPTGNPDRDFVLMMTPHHQGAIDMAKVELQYGTDPELRRLATDIIAAQEKEIAQMKAMAGEKRQVAARIGQAASCAPTLAFSAWRAGRGSA